MSAGTSSRRWPAFAIAAVFALIAGASIFASPLKGRGAEDQINYHERVIRTFAAQWPRPDLSDYLSATTPGYHLGLAVVCRYVGEDVHILRAAGALITIGWLATLALWCARHAPGVAAFAGVLPLALSLYVYESGAWLLPDNTAWWGVACLLFISLWPRWDARGAALGATAAAFLVFTRQSHLWAMGLLWATAWLGPPGASNGEPLWSDGRGGIRGLLAAAREDLLEGIGARAMRLAGALAASLPAILIVAYFCRLWGGLTVPFFQQPDPNLKVEGGNPATPAFILTLISGYSLLLFVPFWSTGFLLLVRKYRVALLATIAIGLLAGLVPRTSWDQPDGRWGGIWEIVRRFPAPAGRSPLIVAGSVFGAIATASWLFTLRRRDSWIFAAAIAGFTAAQSTNFNCWQRYCEPLLLMLIAMMASRVPDANSPRKLPSRVIAFGILALGLAAAAAWDIRTSGPAKFFEHREPHQWRPP